MRVKGGSETRIGIRTGDQPGSKPLQNNSDEHRMRGMEMVDAQSFNGRSHSTAAIDKELRLERKILRAGR